MTVWLWHLFWGVVCVVLWMKLRAHMPGRRHAALWQPRRRVLILGGNWLLLALLFYNSPVDLGSAVERYTEHVTIASGDPFLKLLEWEHGKAVNEIQERIKQGNDWYRLKFTLIGGLIGALVAYLGLKAKDNDGTGGTPGEETLKKIANSNATCFILAAATSLALLIDMHNRLSDAVNKQIGLWIAHYVEPALMGNAGRDNHFVGWENFLRQPPSAMHTDPQYALAVLSYGHLSTWLLFLAFLLSFQAMMRRQLDPAQPVPDRFQRTVPIIGFGVIHLLVLALAVMAHTAPAQFVMNVFGMRLPADWAWLPFVLPWLSLVLLNSFYALPLLSNRSRAGQ